MADVHYIGEDMLETVTGLTVDGATISDATITYELTDASGENVLTTGTYTADGDGAYSANIDADVTELEVEGREYYLLATITSGTVDGFRRLRRVAQYRGAS